MPPVMTETLPASLLERFAGDERTRLLHLLVFHHTVDGARTDGRAGSVMGAGDPQTMRLVAGRRPS